MEMHSSFQMVSKPNRAEDTTALNGIFLSHEGTVHFYSFLCDIPLHMGIVESTSVCRHSSRSGYDCSLLQKHYSLLTPLSMRLRLSPRFFDYH
jgi:hypothetical protein